METSTKTIFVSVASYRDTELIKTIEDAKAKALYPDRVFFGVCNQMQPSDAGCGIPDMDNVRQIVIDPSTTKGACYARSRIYKELLRDEDYVLQIDSHSRFDPGWDVSMIEQLENVMDPHAVMSSYPAGYNPSTGELHEHMFVRFRVTAIDDDGLPLIGNTTTSMDLAPVNPERTPFIAGGCFFTRSITVREVPYDPFLYFLGEEQSYGMRLWTHGYNIYIPLKPFLRHDYMRGMIRQVYHHHNDHAVVYRERVILAAKRLKHLFGLEASTDQEVIQDIQMYGFGKERTFTQWQYHFGVHLRKRLIVQDAMDGKFNQNPEPNAEPR